MRGHLAQAAVAHDESPVDDISITFLHIQVDPDSQCIADGKMQQRPVGAALVDLVGPQGGVEEPGPGREEVLQEERPNGGVAVIGDGDSISGHVLDQFSVFAKIKVRSVVFGSCLRA